MIYNIIVVEEVESGNTVIGSAFSDNENDEPVYQYYSRKNVTINGEIKTIYHNFPANYDMEQSFKELNKHSNILL